MRLTEVFNDIKKHNKSIAIAVEGGGLRGIVSAAFLNLFVDFGLVANVKLVSGTSSGAINSAYFLNQNMERLFGLYRTMASRQFLQPWRWPDAMNFKYLFEEQIPQNYPLDLTALRTDARPFYISVTDVLTGRSDCKLAQDCATDTLLYNLIRASASSPLFSTNQEILFDRAYNDGHIEQAVPYQILLDKNTDYIFCLLTREKGYQKRDSFFDRAFTSLALRKYPVSYRASFKDSHRKYNDQLQFIFSGSNQKIIPIHLNAGDYMISKMTTNPSDVDKTLEMVRKNFY